MSTMTSAVAMPSVEGFHVHHELGHGGMGNVYLARHEVSARWVALKLIASADEHVAKAHVRFAREIAAVSRVHHPNVVRLLGHGVHGGAPYALFELVDGCDLGCVRNRLPWPVVVHLGRQLARALAAVHDAGLLHRDIKPANLMVSRTCRLTLIDFGLAKPAAGDEWDDDEIGAGSEDDALTEPGSIAGTPRYLAPEVRCGEPASIASDLYSFGLVLYQMLTGRTPSTETSVAESDQLDVPRLLRDLVARCLEPEPAARLQRASGAIVVLDALDAQPGMIVRACMAGRRAGRGGAVAATRFVGIGYADATAPTGRGGLVVAQVGRLPDRHTGGGASPLRHRPAVDLRAAEGSAATARCAGAEPTWFPTLAHPRR